MQYKIIFSAFALGLSLVSAQRGGNSQGFKDPKSSATSVATSATSAASAVATATNTATPTSGKGNTGKGVAANGDALDANAVQTGSDQDGTQASGSQAGQVASATDAANFINFCAGKTLTNGLQVKTGSCNGIPMGDIPSTENMVSTVITFPENGATIPANTNFSLAATSINMQFGAFTNAQATYYSAPQQLNAAGDVIGHLHFSVQLMSAANVKTPLDPKTFAFFKGVNDAGNGNGALTAAVAGGLAAGQYRVCTMTSSSNHQPVLMPVAQRGPQDDCVRFTVADGAGGKGNTGKSTGTGVNAGAGTASSSSEAAGAAASSTAKAEATATSSSVDTKETGKNVGKGIVRGSSSASASTFATSTTSASGSAATASTSTEVSGAGATGEAGKGGKGGNTGKSSCNGKRAEEFVA